MQQRYSQFYSWNNGNDTQLPARRYDEVDLNQTTWNEELNERIFEVFNTHSIRFVLQESGLMLELILSFKNLRFYIAFSHYFDNLTLRPDCGEIYQYFCNIFFSKYFL